MKTGIELIAEKRSAQISKGYDAEHDSGETSFELSTAAGHYIANAQNKYFEDHSHSDGEPCARFQTREFESEEWEEVWPWSDNDERHTSDIINSLAKAGALIAAEIDRLQHEES